MRKPSDKPPEVPQSDWIPYRDHRYNAQRRGIAFELTFEEWWSWWQIDGRWLRRGVGRNKLCMCRNRDLGPYRLDNIYCETQRQNTKDIDPKRRSKAHIKRGADNPSSKPVLTPLGRFGSARLADKAHGFAVGYTSYMVRTAAAGWSRPVPVPDSS